MFDVLKIREGKPIRPNMSVRMRLLFTMAISGFVLICFIVSAVYILMARIEHNLWESRQQDAADNASLAVAAYLGQVSHALDGLGMEEVTEVVYNKADFLQNWLEDNPDFQEVALFDINGGVIGAASYGTPLLISDAEQTSWYKAATTGLPMMGEVSFSAEHNPYIIIAQPGDHGSVVAARLNVDILGHIVHDVRFGKTGVTYIVEKSGVIVGHPDEAVTYKHASLVNRPEWQSILSAETNRWVGSYENFLGRDVLARSQTIANTDWIIITEVDKAEAHATTRWGISSLTLTVICLAILGLAIAHRLLNGQVFTPLQTLQKQIRWIAQGQYKPLNIDSMDEMGELSQALNDLSELMRQRDTRIACQTQALSSEVTIHKQAQEHLQQLKEQLQKSSNYKENFLTTMSHELRTPLNGILGMSEALVVPVYGPLNDQQTKAINHIQESGRQLLGLIDDMLDYSKLTDGSVPLNYSSVNIREVVEVSVDKVRPMLQAKKIGLHRKIDPNIEGVIADYHRLKQIIVNLLNNACKFSAEGGQIALEIKSDAKLKKFRIRVLDTGIGIEEEAIEDIFDPFFQVESDARRNFGGAGLGLALVKRIVEIHGGNIAVTSKVGRGSCFIVELPWREAEVAKFDPENRRFSIVKETESTWHSTEEKTHPPLHRSVPEAIEDDDLTLVFDYLPEGDRFIAA